MVKNKVFFLLLKAFTISLHIFMLDNDSQLHHPHLFLLLHLSLLTSCLGNIQWRGSPTALVSCCNSFFLECFMFHVSKRQIHIYTFFTSFESSLFFPLTSLGLSLRVRARSRITGRSRACLLLFRLRFQFRSIFLSLFFSLSFFRNWRRDSILRPSERMHERKKCCAFFLKTTVPWPRMKYDLLNLTCDAFKP